MPDGTGGGRLVIRRFCPECGIFTDSVIRDNTELCAECDRNPYYDDEY